MSTGKRGRDRIPYGQPGSNRRPGRGRQAVYPWRTWLGEAKTWELEYNSLEAARRARASIAVRVSRVNRQLREAGSPGWVAHRFTLRPGHTDPELVGVDLTFWWFDGSSEEPAASFPNEVLDLFARRTNMAAEDRAVEQSQLQVPAYGPEYQARLVEILCPTQYGQPAEVLSSPAFDHWRGWKPDECEACFNAGGPVDLGIEQ